jgi:hypothetical protein
LGFKKTTFMQPIVSRLKWLAAVLFTTSVLSHAQFSVPPVQLQIPQGKHNIPFRWSGDSLNGQWNAHMAMLVPVKLPGCAHTFFMQFDLGSPITMFYKPALNFIAGRYAATRLCNTASKLYNYPFSIGKTTIKAREIAVMQAGDSAITAAQLKKGLVIGTLGSDLIDGRVLHIDYPGRRLLLYDSIPADMLPELQLHDFIFAARRILLPATLLNSNIMLMFDTGSSGFGLLTSKENCLQLAKPGSKPVVDTVNSWGRPLAIYTLPGNDSIAVAGHRLPLPQVSWAEGVSAAQVNQMIKLGIGGLTGNTIFLKSQLILDTKHKKMGLFARPLKL